MKQKTIASRHLRTKIAAGYVLILFVIFPCRRICTNKTNVPADLHELLSAAKNLPELSIRIFNPLATRADRYVATRLMCRLICNLPEYNIRIFQSACFLFFDL